MLESNVSAQSLLISYNLSLIISLSLKGKKRKGKNATVSSC
jgi:hypothetical protein